MSCQELLLIPACCLAFVAAAQDADTFDPSVPNAFYQFTLEVVRTTEGVTPPVAARAYGYMGLGLYEAVRPGMPGHATLGPALPDQPVFPQPLGGTQLHWPTVATHVLSTMIDSMYVNMTPLVRNQLYTLRDDFDALHASQLPLQTFIRSVAHGEAVANAVLDHARTDGQYNGQFNNFPGSYIPPIGDCLWVPEQGEPAMQPYWGETRPFILADTTQANLAPPAPPCSDQPGSVLYDAALEVYDVVNNLTPADLTIAEYWNDVNVTPPAHVMTMTAQTLRNGPYDLAFATKAYAMCGIGVAEAFIACWRTKYRDNLLRPITYINLYIDPDWDPAVPTPPFPEYVSGHSTQSHTWADLMTHLFGANHAFTDSTHQMQFGGPRTFSSFLECAEEAAASRVLGGIHYRFSDTLGSELGVRCAQNTLALFDQVVTSVPDHMHETSQSFIHDAVGQTIRLVDTAVSEAVLMDLSGRIILRWAGPQAVDIRQLPPGVYLARSTRGPMGVLRFVR